MKLEKLYEIYLRHPRVQTDTRKIQAGELFFALKGPQFNGNQFAGQALEAGALCVVADEETGIQDERIFLVDDVLSTLQDLALHHRKQFQIPFLAITGSNGKTTTKELIHAVLSTGLRTYTTRGNLNNHIGIPLTLLSVGTDAEIAVIEMGANHQKEIESYCRYTLPTHGIITNCGKAHLEGFGGVEGVRKGKGELYDYLRAQGGTVFLCQDLDYLVDMSRGIREIVTYGSRDASVTAVATASEPFLQVRVTGGLPEETIQTQLVGDYNLPNVQVSLSVGKYFGIPFEKIRSAIESYTPSNSRSQLLRKGSNEIILDAYNANPTSMRAAIENFARQQHPSKYILLGGMMELGDESLEEHREIVRLLLSHTWKEVILVGGDFGRLPEQPFRFFSDAGQAATWLRAHPVSHSLLLVKGSRSMKMETLVDSL